VDVNLRSQRNCRHSSYCCTHHTACDPKSCNDIP